MRKKNSLLDSIHKKTNFIYTINSIKRFFKIIRLSFICPYKK